MASNNTLKTLLNDEELHDVTLQGNDGVGVSACRNVLAAKSPVLRRMLYGDFAEAQSSLVKIKEYPGHILGLIVHFCFMDNLEPLETEGEGSMNDDDDDDADRLSRAMERAVTLLDACHFFQIEMQEKMNTMTLSWMENEPVTALVALDLIFRNGGELPAFDETKRNAMEIVRENIANLIETKNARQLGNVHPTIIGNILQDNCVESTEYSLFQFLKAWYEVDPRGKVDGYVGEKKNRQETAANLASCINLKRIRPSLLVGPVASSGLVLQSKLLEVYKAQALAFESLDGNRFLQPRSAYLTWKNSGSKLTKIKPKELARIDCPGLTLGKYEWKIKVVQMTHDLRVGICCFNRNGKATKAVAFKSNGELNLFRVEVRNSSDVPPSFAEGSILRLRLSIENDGRASFSIAVDNDNFQTFEKHVLFDDENGPIPYATCDHGRCQIRLLGFTESMV